VNFMSGEVRIVPRGWQHRDTNKSKERQLHWGGREIRKIYSTLKEYGDDYEAINKKCNADRAGFRSNKFQIEVVQYYILSNRNRAGNNWIEIYLKDLRTNLVI